MPETEYTSLKPRSARYHKMHPRSFALTKLEEIIRKLGNLPPDTRLSFKLDVAMLSPAEAAQTKITWQLRPRL